MRLFLDKNLFLRGIYREVDYITLYRDVFPLGSFERKGFYCDNKGNGIAVIIDKSSYHRVTVTDEHNELTSLVDNDFVIFNGLSYYGKQRTMKNSNYLYALIFDIDGISSISKLENLISHVSTGINPRPTYIVNSGHGVHLYYIFKEPIPLYNHLKDPLKRLKYSLTSRLWNMYVSDIKEVQYQGLNQGFRMVGSPTKLGKEYRLTAFQTGDKVDLDYLNTFVTEVENRVTKIDYNSTISLCEAKQKYPEWYDRLSSNEVTKKSWTVKRDLYDWWIRKIKEGATYGHRYFCIMALAIYATKCDIPYEELETDALDLIKHLNNLNPSEPFTHKDVLSALNSYGENFKTFPRSDIQKLTAIEIKKNKRNYRSQETHLKLARGQLALLRELEEVKEGRPLGSGTKEKLVINYITEYPDANVSQIARDLKISRPTVYKYLNKDKNK